MKLNDKIQQLPPIQSSRRYNTSIPEGRASIYAPSQIPIIQSRKGSLVKRDDLTSAKQLMTNPSLIDKKLKSMSMNNTNDFRINLETDKKQKANLKFLKYKFNPGSSQENQNFDRANSQLYGQLQLAKKQKISINTFYQHRNVLFQDERAPLVYKRLFLQKDQLE